MTTETVRVVARITAQPGKVEELKSILLDVVGPTRQDLGCISYQLLQNREDPGDFTFVEEWESDTAIDAHLVTAHVQDALSKAQPLLSVAPDIRRYVIIA